MKGSNSHAWYWSFACQLAAMKLVHLIHHDIKPNNTLLCPTDHQNIRLIEFDIACRCLHPGTDPGRSRNTFRRFHRRRIYLASEVWLLVKLSLQLDTEQIAQGQLWFVWGCLPWNTPRINSSLYACEHCLYSTRHPLWPALHRDLISRNCTAYKILWGQRSELQLGNGLGFENLRELRGVGIRFRMQPRSGRWTSIRWCLNSVIMMVLCHASSLVRSF